MPSHTTPKDREGPARRAFRLGRFAALHLLVLLVLLATVVTASASLPSVTTPAGVPRSYEVGGRGNGCIAWVSARAVVSSEGLDVIEATEDQRKHMLADLEQATHETVDVDRIFIVSDPKATASVLIVFVSDGCVTAHGIFPTKVLPSLLGGSRLNSF